MIIFKMKKLVKNVLIALGYIFTPLFWIIFREPKKKEEYRCAWVRYSFYKVQSEEFKKACMEQCPIYQGYRCYRWDLCYPARMKLEKEE